MERSQKVSLGCGTLILIAVIVAIFAIFAEKGSREVAQRVEQLREESARLDKQVAQQTRLIEALGRRHEPHQPASRPAASRPALFRASGPRVGWLPGTVEGASQRLVAFQVLRDPAPEVVTVGRDFGLLLIWDENVRRFFIFDNASRSYLVTDDYNRFLAELATLPAGLDFELLDTCTVPRAWKMPGKDWDRMVEVLRQKRPLPDEMDDLVHRVCTCESHGMKLLGDKADPEPPSAPRP